MESNRCLGNVQHGGLVTPEDLAENLYIVGSVVMTVPHYLCASRSTLYMTWPLDINIVAYVNTEHFCGDVRFGLLKNHLFPHLSNLTDQRHCRWETALPASWLACASQQDESEELR